MITGSLRVVWLTRRVGRPRSASSCPHPRSCDQNRPVGAFDELAADACPVGTCHAPGVGANADDELRLVPGFRELADASDTLAAALEASHMLPADRLGDLLRQAGKAIGATDVSMWVIDYGQTTLVPIDDDGGRAADGSHPALDVASTTAGRAFARAHPIESDEPDPHRWIPLVDGTERLGVLRFAFAEQLTDENRRQADALGLARR